jgi:hypothetical protein
MATPRARQTPTPAATTLVDPNQPHDPEGDEFAEDDDDGEDPFGDLAFLTNADTDITWGVERYKTADEMRENPRGRGRVFVTTIDGAINLVAFQREHGGGVFRFFGKRGTQLIGSKRLELAGPRINYNANPQPAAQPVQTSPTINGNGGRGGDDDTRRLMRRLYRKITALEQRATQPPAVVQAPAPQPLSVETVFALAERMAKNTQPPENTLTPVIEAFTKGLDLGSTREPSAEPADSWLSIAKEFAPAIKDVLAMVVAAQRARSGGPAIRPQAAGQPTTPRRPSGTFDSVPEAVVVETAQPAVPPQPETPAVSHRWLTAVEALANAVTLGDDPQDFSITLERILDAQELFQLKSETTDSVIARLEPAMALLPVLKSPQARAFIEAALTELRNPTEDGAEGGK